MNNLIILIIEFFKTGLFAVGGGLATIPFLVEMGEKYHFFEYDELLTMLGVSESTPGAIGINMATYVGIKAAGVLGGLVSTISIVLPSIIIILMIARIIKKYRESIYVDAIMETLKPMSIGFIIAAIIPVVISLFKTGNMANWLIVGIIAIIFTIRQKFNKLHPGFIILGAFVLGICIDLL